MKPSLKCSFMRKITFVQAPEIPFAELKILEQHWQEAIEDPTYKVVTNYDPVFHHKATSVNVKELTIDTRNTFLNVNADGVPTNEVKDLRKRVSRGLRKKDSIIFTNYPVQVRTRPATGVIIPQAR